MPFSARGLFVCIPFLQLEVRNAQQNHADQWCADFTPGVANQIRIEAYTTAGTQVVWSVTSPGAAPVFTTDPDDDNICQLALNNPANVVAADRTIRVQAEAHGITQTVEIIIYPHLISLVPTSNGFEDAAGWYAPVLAGIPGVVAAATTYCSLEVSTNPDTAAARSHVTWLARNTATGQAYQLTPIDAQHQGIPLDVAVNVQASVGIIGSTQAQQTVTVDVRNPVVAADLANTLSIELNCFTFAGGGHFVVTQEDAGHFNQPYSRDWCSGVVPAPPQAYSAGANMTLNNVRIRVTRAPNADTPVWIRATVYFFPANGPIVVRSATVNHTFNNGDAGEQNAGNIDIGGVPNEVMVNEPLLIFWEASDDNGATWSSLRITSNTVYVTGRAPVATTVPELNSGGLGPVYPYLSLLDMSCRAANGLAGGDGAAATAVRDAISGLFTPANNNAKVRRITPCAQSQLRYWHQSGRPNYLAPAQSLNGDGSLSFNKNTSKYDNKGNMFTNPHGNIACGVWAKILIAMWALHGYGNGRFIGVWSRNPDMPNLPNNKPVALPNAVNESQFNVMNWEYNNHNNLNPDDYTHRIIATLGGGMNIPAGGANRAAPVENVVAGQNNPNPPDRFVNHFIVRDGNNDAYVDPSYGTQRTDRTGWVNASIGGLENHTVSPFTAGFMRTDGSPNPDAVALYDFCADQWVP